MRQPRQFKTSSCGAQGMTPPAPAPARASPERATHSSCRPTAVSRLTPTLCAWQLPASVRHGTPAPGGQGRSRAAGLQQRGRGRYQQCVERRQAGVAAGSRQQPSGAPSAALTHEERFGGGGGARVGPRVQADIQHAVLQGQYRGAVQAGKKQGLGGGSLELGSRPSASRCSSRAPKREHQRACDRWSRLAAARGSRSTRQRSTPASSNSRQYWLRTTCE